MMGLTPVLLLAGVMLANSEVRFRLENGTDIFSGRIGVYYRREWGTVCDDYFGATEAEVVCRSFGFSGGREMIKGYYGPGMGPIWMDNVNCTGSEYSLSHCHFDGWGKKNCQHKTDAGVQCEPTNVEFRLAGGPNQYAGTVEVLYNQTWGQVCGEGFDKTVASVLCRSLGFRGGEVRTHIYGGGTGSFWLKIESCRGDEHSLPYCNVKWGENSCSSRSTAAVECALPDDCDCVRDNMHSCNLATGRCNCKIGWTGTSCDQDVNECDHPEIYNCPKESKCQNLPGSYYCEHTSLPTHITVILSIMGGLILALIAAVVSLVFRHTKTNKQRRSILKEENEDKDPVMQEETKRKEPTENSGFEDAARMQTLSSAPKGAFNSLNDEGYGTANSQTEPKETA